MTPPAFVRFSLTIDPATYDRAVTALLDLPTPGWQEEDEGGHLIFWLSEQVLADESVTAGVTRLGALGRLHLAPERDDWESRWRAFHHTVVVGDVCVRPPWEAARPSHLDVLIDVGMAFGTGTHATTRQCLAALQELESGSLLDVGAGSGVLALAALRLGFAPVYACDNDPFALAALAKNARLNDLEPVLLPLDVTDPETRLPAVDAVVANVALGPIVALGRRLHAAIGDGPCAPRDLVLAGLLAQQADEALAAFPRYVLRERMCEGEWVLLRLGRP